VNAEAASLGAAQGYAEAKPLLSLEGVTRRFGGLTAVKDLTFSVADCTIFGLIGPNGAGKTTVFNLITGIYPASEGVIRLNGKPIEGMAPHRVAALGIARTFQNIRLFNALSVLDNVRLAKHMRRKQGLLSVLLRTTAFAEEEKTFEQEAMHLLGLFGLAELAHEAAGNLPYGSQRRLEIARALATGPKVLLLDEPAAGMNPQESQELLLLIRRLRDEFKCAILLVEHNMKVVMGVCEHIHVIDHGETIAAGDAHHVRHHPKVIEAYLGGA
jgi:branched-chain amino acid transport system ATP-binding protein